MPLDTIVVPIDFSDTSLHALRLAKELARPSQARLHLLHVILDSLTEPWLLESPGTDLMAMTEQWRQEASDRLEEIAREEGLERMRVTVAVPAGKPSVAILDYAESHGANLIVMGAHGDSAVVRFFLGSVAERVVRHSHVPVLTVPRSRGGLIAAAIAAQSAANAAAR